jgi:hypothetical protein
MNRFSIFQLILALVSLNINVIISGQEGIKSVPYVINVKDNIKNIQEVRLSTLGSNISYIPLQTSPDCLIQELRKIEINESYIFVSEYSRLLQFDRKGNFIRQIGSAGRGPGEYTVVFDFCIDDQKKEIFIISHSPYRLLKFDYEGVFKKSVNLPFRPGQVILKDKNSLMYHHVNSPGKDEPSWVLTNKDGNVISTMKNTLQRKVYPGLVVQISPLYKFNNEIHFMEFGVDTLYYFNKLQKNICATFLFGEFKMEPDQDPRNIELGKKLRENLKGKLRIGSILENNEYLFVSILLGGTNAKMFAVYNKRNNSFVFLKNSVFKNDLGPDIGFWPKQIINDNILVDYVDAFELMKHPLPSELRGRITETSNPVIVMVNR